MKTYPINLHAELFASLLNAKFSADGDTFTVQQGPKYGRIVITTYGHNSVHAFVDREGHVLKAAGWATPAKGIRYNTVTEAAEAASRHGAYLYR